jgi:hypothetical protein
MLRTRYSFRDSRHTQRHGERHACSTTDPAGALQTILDFCAVARTHRNRKYLGHNVIHICALINSSSQCFFSKKMFRGTLSLTQENHQFNYN